jgi:hypothetical protein
MPGLSLPYVEGTGTEGIMGAGPASGNRFDERHEHMHTSCGREVTVGRLSLGDQQHPSARVFVDMGECPSGNPIGWASLTLAEARQLAQAILTQATAAERECPWQHA